MAKTDLKLSFQFRNRRFTDAEAGLRFFASELEKDFELASRVLTREMKTFLDSVAAALAERHGDPWQPGGSRPNQLYRRTGEGIKGILQSVEIKGKSFSEIRGFIGAPFPMSVHEDGATIRPVTKKWLTIPLPTALDNRGVPLKRGARDWANTFVQWSKAGNLIIFQKRGREIVPLYVLKKQVTIPPRLGMQATIDAGLPFFVDEAMDAMVKELLGP